MNHSVAAVEAEVPDSRNKRAPLRPTNHLLALFAIHLPERRPATRGLYDQARCGARRIRAKSITP